MRAHTRTGLRAFIALIAAAVLAAAATTAFAQTSEEAQGRSALLAEDVAPITPPLEAAINYRQEMRELVQSISAYARQLNPDFIIIVRGALDLVAEQDEAGRSERYAARAYFRTIDSIMVEGLNYGYRALGEPTGKERRAGMMRLLDQAAKARLGVLSVDYTADKSLARKSYQTNSKLGFLPWVSPVRGLDMNAIPSYPSPPFQENARSILTINQARNFVWIRDPSAFGREDAFALHMRKNNFDILISSVYLGLKPLSRTAVNALKFKRVGSKRLVLAHMDIGAVASYAYYWRPHWQEGSPAFISTPTRGGSDRYFAEYWRPEWRKILTGNPQSFIYGLVRQGYDGALLDTAHAHRFFGDTLQDMGED